MKIEIEVSDKNEGTSSPWWMILDPQQNMRCSPHSLAGQVTGPFFSREEATLVMNQKKHHYSDRAIVYCASGYYTNQYHTKCVEAQMGVVK